MNSQSPHHPRYLVAILIVAVLLVSAMLSAVPLFIEGVQRSADTKNFLRCATSMLEQPGLGKAITGNLISPWCRSYTGFLIILAPIIYLFGDQWNLVLVSLNILFHSIAITLCFTLIYHLTKKISLSFATAALLAFSVDVLIRVHWPLADSFFFMMTTMAFVGVSLAIIYPHSKGITLAALLVLVLAGLTKPHGLIILSIGLPAVLVRAWLANLRSEVALVILCLTISLIVTSFLLISWIINPEYQPLNFEVAIMKEFLMSGQVIEGVYSTYNSGTDRFFVRFWTMCERFLTFFSFLPVHWSNQHIALSSMFFIPSYLGIVFCWIRLAKNRLDAKFNDVVLLFTLWILGFATFAGWFDVSYEFRYRLPIMGLFAVSTTLGLYAMVSRNLPITDLKPSERA